MLDINKSAQAYKAYLTEETGVLDGEDETLLVGFHLGYKQAESDCALTVDNIDEAAQTIYESLRDSGQALCNDSWAGEAPVAKDAYRQAAETALRGFLGWQGPNDGVYAAAQGVSNE
ncbi:hypothetical protein BACT_1091 [Bifidobacterium actinocoloniiforme DSM 22766]|uniref:Uncharacterized protein n=1 Tax=Bifidobacterium actinocoloniiforme DSM 22766 TaxID=1437605 RepID=A0A086Z1I9_9BIFI|nr:hypothetical protein [Bifidobacterium actinocoloniiforme]AKV55527.1 hypothetical protein AB656_04070 [Bifidobacterium actinocoloniiforme DSM 22766]KFI40389.1 hypothetical protein BACT_1091 [Bifidobacterium actinocoloniiforme DSM 22766]